MRNTYSKSFHCTYRSPILLVIKRDFEYLPNSASSFDPSLLPTNELRRFTDARTST